MKEGENEIIRIGGFFLWRDDKNRCKSSFFIRWRWCTFASTGSSM